MKAANDRGAKEASYNCWNYEIGSGKRSALKGLVFFVAAAAIATAVLAIYAVATKNSHNFKIFCAASIGCCVVTGVAVAILCFTRSLAPVKEGVDKGADKGGGAKDDVPPPVPLIPPRADGKPSQPRADGKPPQADKPQIKKPTPAVKDLPAPSAPPASNNEPAGPPPAKPVASAPPAEPNAEFQAFKARIEQLLKPQAPDPEAVLKAFIEQAELSPPDFKCAPGLQNAIDAYCGALRGSKLDPKLINAEIARINDKISRFQGRPLKQQDLMPETEPTIDPKGKKAEINPELLPTILAEVRALPESCLSSELLNYIFGVEQKFGTNAITSEVRKRMDMIALKPQMESLKDLTFDAKTALLRKLVEEEVPGLEDPFWTFYPTLKKELEDLCLAFWSATFSNRTMFANDAKEVKLQTEVKELSKLLYKKFLEGEPEVETEMDTASDVLLAANTAAAEREQREADDAAAAERLQKRLQEEDDAELARQLAGEGRPPGDFADYDDVV